MFAAKVVDQSCDVAVDIVGGEQRKRIFEKIKIVFESHQIDLLADQVPVSVVVLEFGYFA